MQAVLSKMKQNSTDIESPAVDIVLTVSFAVLVIINLISNTLVCVVIWRYRETKNFMNYLVVNLAFADIMVALFIAPQYVLRHWYKHPEGVAGDVLCKLVTGGNFIWAGELILFNASIRSFCHPSISPFLLLSFMHISLPCSFLPCLPSSIHSLIIHPFFHSFPILLFISITVIGGAASAFTLAAIAIERYFAISNPERSEMSSRRVKGIIITSWIYAIAFNLPLFFIVKYEYLPNDFRCPEKWPKVIYAKFYTIGAFIVMGAIPIGMMVVFYSLTVQALWRNRLQATTRSDLAIVRQRKKATKMMFVVSTLYAICWLPNLILYMLSTYEPTLYAYFSTSYVVSVALVCANSAMNPFVYTFHSSRFRNELKSILCCIRHRHVDFLRSF